MNCPRNHGELRECEVNDAMVSICGECGGMYLERGELNRVAGPTKGDLEFSTIDLDTFQHDDEYGPIACPRDPGTPMKKVEFNILSNIILDFCGTCLGFWVDGRELARIQDEVREYNEVEKENIEPWSVRLSQFFWALPFPH